MDNIETNEGVIGVEAKQKSEIKQMEIEITKVVKQDVIYTIKSVNRCGQEQIIKKLPPGSRFYDIMQMK
jgi:hypothetical protein